MWRRGAPRLPLYSPRAARFSRTYSRVHNVGRRSSAGSMNSPAHCPVLAGVLIVTRAMGAVQDVLAQVELSYGDAKVAVKERGTPGADGNLEMYLREALIAVGETAKATGVPLLICIDDVQAFHLRDEGRDLGALIAAIHRVGQRGLPVGLLAAGLPQIHGILSRLRSYTERFQYVRVGALATAEAEHAIRQPVRDRKADITADALAYIVEQTGGYPAFLQEYGYHTWNLAEGPLVTREDAERGHAVAAESLDRGFFEARMQRVTEREKEYAYAMAALGTGPNDSADVAKQLREAPQAVSPYRDGLIKKGIA